MLAGKELSFASYSTLPSYYTGEMQIGPKAKDVPVTESPVLHLWKDW